jgi:uncharacterized protein
MAKILVTIPCVNYNFAIKPSRLMLAQNLIVTNHNINDQIDGWSPLMVAALTYLETEVNTLIEAGAYLDLQDNDGRTALMHAIRTSFPNSAIKLLINAGCKIDLQDKYGFTALMRGIKSFVSNHNIITLLNAGTNIDLQDHDGQSALIFATINDEPDTIKILLDAGANVFFKNKYGWSFLKIAILQHAKSIDLIITTIINRQHHWELSPII